MSDDRTRSFDPDDDRTLASGHRDTTPPEEDIGAVIGPYRLVRLLGEGGMGRVFAAEQTEPIRRRVALKVIKQGMDTGRVVARFEAERQALALMDHPCIARVFEAGATGRGRPYFVMELVDGEPITDYCNNRRLGLRERLELFVQVCAGVQHAHQKAVIHRDLKPSNILVAEVDGRPAPKIIDFGVAKATTESLTGMTLFTQMGQMVGTPEYMSPEQAGLTEDDIDTRTDIYSLGVVLYELLVGARPFESQELRKAGYDAIRRIIMEQDPPRPSTRFGSLGERATTVASSHGTAPRRLQSELRGDLDWITMKALEKNRDRRYETANGLAADVGRHLRNEPVTAGPPSAAYRLGKLVRRNRGAFAVGGLLVLMLAVLAGSMTLQAGRLARERDRTAVQAAKAEKTTDFLQSMLGGITPATARGRDTRLLEEILKNTADRTGAELAGQPEVEAAIRTTLGTTYAALGRYAEARANLERADSLQTALLGPAAGATLTTRRLLGVTDTQAGNQAQAELQLRTVVAAARESLGPDDPVTLAAMLDLCDLLNRMGKNQESQDLGAAALAGLERAAHPVAGDVQRARTSLAIATFGLQHIDEAIVMITGVLDERTATLGADHPSALSSRATLAYFQERGGQGEEAVRNHEEVVAAALRIYGPDHPETIRFQSNLAVALGRLGRNDEAEQLQRRILAADTTIFGAENPVTLQAMIDLGSTLMALRRYEEAEAGLDQALAISEHTLGVSHRLSIQAMSVLAWLYNEQRRFGESAEMSGRIAEAAAGNFGETHPTTVIYYYNWAAKLQDMGDNAAAEPVYGKAIELHERGGGGDQPYVAAALNGLGRALAARRADAAADSLLEAGLAMRRRMFGDTHTEVAYSLASLGEAHHGRGDHAGAVVFLAECTAIRDSLLAADDWQRWATRLDLARCLVDLGRRQEAVPYLETAVTGLEASTFTADLAEEAGLLLAQARR